MSQIISLWFYIGCTTLTWMFQSTKTQGAMHLVLSENCPILTCVVGTNYIHEIVSYNVSTICLKCQIQQNIPQCLPIYRLQRNCLK